MSPHFPAFHGLAMRIPRAHVVKPVIPVQLAHMFLFTMFLSSLQGVGIGLAAILTMVRIWNDADEQIYDRSYRLRHNKGQVRMDKFTYGSALAGGIVGMAAVPWSVAAGVQGASMGIGLSVFAHTLTSKMKKN